MKPYSLYIHIPFCRKRCAYCDFNTYAGLESLIPDYLRALEKEIALASQAAGAPLPVHTVYFGGGTPSLLAVEEVGRVLKVIADLSHPPCPATTDFVVALPLKRREKGGESNMEITLEANPGDLSLEYLRGLRNLGVNRLSLGMQSSQVDELHMLGRRHSLEDVRQSVSWARQAGFENLSLDLIFGLPGQRLESWANTLETALALRPEHLSLYDLMLEEGTPLARQVSAGRLPRPDADLAADMYELAMERLEGAGFVQYEISNWARREADGRAWTCQHNLQYWRMLPFLGFGAGAHGFVCAAHGSAGGMHTANVPSPAEYIQRMSAGAEQRDESHLRRLSASSPVFPHTPATVESTPLDRRAEMAEVMMMGLRLVEEGVGEADFAARFGEPLAEAYGEAIRKLEHDGLLEWAGDRLRLTRRGRLLGNVVFREFV